MKKRKIGIWVSLAVAIIVFALIMGYFLNQPSWSSTLNFLQGIIAGSIIAVVTFSIIFIVWCKIFDEE